MISRSCSQSWVNGSIATVYYHASGYSYGSRWWSWSLHKAGLEETQSRLLSGYLWQMNRTSIQVAKLEGKGRGLVATRKVAAGDLLLQEIPLMVIDSEDREVGAIFNWDLFYLNIYRFQVMYSKWSSKQWMRSPKAKCWSSLIQCGTI